MSAVAALSGRRRLSPGEIELVIAAHERFVAGRPGGKRASLRFVDFSGVDLCGRNLSDADLSASIFDHAKLAGTNLTRANLFGSDLREADLAESDLSEANLQVANLIDANLGTGLKSGYSFVGGRTASSAATPATFFFSTIPQTASGVTATGTRRFAIATDGVILYDSTVANLGTQFTANANGSVTGGTALGN